MSDNDTLFVVGGVAILGYVVYREVIKPLQSAASAVGSVATGAGHIAGDIGSGVVGGADAIGGAFAWGGKGLYHFFQPGSTPGIIAPDKSKSIAARSFAPEPSRGAKGAPYQGQASAALHRQQAHAPKTSGATVKPGFGVSAIPPPGFGTTHPTAPHKAPRKVAKTPPKTSSHHPKPKVKTPGKLVAV